MNKFWVSVILLIGLILSFDGYSQNAIANDFEAK